MGIFRGSPTETKGLSAQDCEVNITNESVSRAQGVGSPSDDPWGVLEASGRGGGGAEQVALQEKQCVSRTRGKAINIFSRKFLVKPAIKTSHGN